MKVKLSVAIDMPKNRLDKFLSTIFSHKISRSKVQDLIMHGIVFVNDHCEKDCCRYLKIRDTIVVTFDEQTTESDLQMDANVEFLILYEDEDLLIVDKPAGIVVHPGAGNHTGTLVNGLMHHCGNSLSQGTDTNRPGIVHRIDKDTSGILVIAKNDFAHANLAEQFASHSITRKYVCFCFAVPQPQNGRIETLIARDKNNRLKMSISKYAGKKAITLYRTITAFSRFAAKIECELKTGRTHQIRVHMSSIGHSLIGDSVYKFKNYPIPPQATFDYVRNFSRQALHAHFLEFLHPTSKKTMTFQSKIPPDMQKLENILLTTN